MPKHKFGGNDKKEEAREREQAKKTQAKEKASKEAEDGYWAAAGEGAKTKAQEKREEEERKRQEQLARKAELKRLQEEEEAALSARKEKLTIAGAQKVTKYQLDAQRELEARMKEEEVREKMMAVKREVDAEAYERMVVAENLNRDLAEGVSARSVGGALAALGVADAAEGDKHPEKRMKAAWKAYEERMLPELKHEKPGLKMSQYKDMMWKLWQKSPDNPLNQAALAAAASK